ncbi:DnaD domain protein [Anaerobranca gottschalkii]|uniref:Replication initiation and membrane attachment n=1 Tax=Anaerobranca gottschalkii DSM 13577 TaxID=1120990 RepID=A0A1H9ZMM7_9FIRM|nr:DnaD domain protein [Anaerobranca gottschalkii]SES82062.1 Replication initiation and membrane attachment [Anaerobranca gottschalkii DSM 13577]
MFITRGNYNGDTIVKYQLLELYQPLLGYEAIALWIYLKHCINNNLNMSFKEIYQKLQMSETTGTIAFKLLLKYQLIKQEKDKLVLLEPMSSNQFIKFVKDNENIDIETKKRFFTLVESYLEPKEEVLLGNEETPFIENSDEITVIQREDELVARFIKECKFHPTKQLRQLFDDWFYHIKDFRLLEELLIRTKNKIETDGIKGCPSKYADKIVKEWLLMGIKTYEDLNKKDQAFKQNWEVYRMVEKELNKGYDTLTPEEKNMINLWLKGDKSLEALSPTLIQETIKLIIRHGFYKGKGSPTVAFVNKIINKLQRAKVKSLQEVEQYLLPKSNNKEPLEKKNFTHEHSKSDLEEAIRKKTLLSYGLNGEGNN